MNWLVGFGSWRTVARRGRAAGVALLISVLVGSSVGGAVKATGEADLGLAVGSVSAVLTPTPTSWVTPDVYTFRPGTEVEYTATFQYDLATVSLETEVTAENTGDVTGTVEFISVVWERRLTGQTAWVGFAAYEEAAADWTPVVPGPSGMSPLDAYAEATAAPDVIYPIGIMPIIGTEIESGAAASWTLTSERELDTIETMELLDSGSIDGIRQVVHLEVSPRDGPSGQPYSATVDATTAIQAADPQLTDATITITPPTGTPVVFDGTTTPDLAAFDIGDPNIVVSSGYGVPEIDPKGQQETDSAYLARLRGYAKDLVTEAVLVGNQGSVEIAVAAGFAFQVEVPIVTGSQHGDDSASSNATLDAGLELSNEGTGLADAIDIAASMPGGVTAGVSGVPADLDPGEHAQAELTFALPGTYAEGMTSTTGEVS